VKCPKCQGTGAIEAATIGDRIEALCEAKGVTLAEVERVTGLAHTTLWRLMTGKGTKSGSLDTLVKVADFFGISLDELVGRKRDVLLGDTQTPLKKYFEWPFTMQPNRCGICGADHGGLACPQLTPMSGTQ